MSSTASTFCVVAGTLLFACGVIAASRDPTRYGPPLGAWLAIIAGAVLLAICAVSL